MASMLETQDPPAYASVNKAGERVVLYKGRPYKDGESFDMTDENGGVVIRAEVRLGKVWVNGSKLAARMGKSWCDWYKLKGTRDLVEKLWKRCPADPPGGLLGCSAYTQTGSGSLACVVDSTRIQYQGIDKENLRGTWITLELATAFVADANPDFRAKWCKIMGKTYSGDHSAVADVLAETDKVAGTESTGAILTKSAATKRRAQDEDRPVEKIRILTDRQLARLREEKMLTVPALVAAYASKLEAEAYVARKEVEIRAIQADTERLKLRLAPPLPEAYIAFMDATAENTRTLYRTAQRGDMFVYAVHVPSTDSHQRLKFGFTSNVEKRFSDYRSLLADMNNKIVLLLPAARPRATEKYIKSSLRGCRVGDNKNTELFDVPFCKFRDVVLEVLDDFGPWEDAESIRDIREALEL